MAPVNHLQKAHIHALGKMAALLHLGAKNLNRRAVHIVHQRHRMGVTHRHGRYQ